jgi:hypothetical protein
VLLLSGILPGRTFFERKYRSPHGLVGLSECFPGHYRLSSNQVIFRLSYERLPLLSFSLFSTSQPKEPVRALRVRKSGSCHEPLTNAV